MIDILVTGEYIFTGRELIRDGYVYMKDGRIASIGSGLPPEDVTYASLVLGGPRRIIVPGLIWPVDPLGYHNRTASCRPAARIGCRERASLGPELEAKASLAPILEAHTHGIAIPLLVLSSPAIAVQLASMIGGRYGALIPEECGPAEPHPALETVSRPPGPASVCIARDLAREDNPHKRASDLARLLGAREPLIREGEEALIAVYDASRPPLLGVRLESDDDAGMVYSLGATVESLIVGEDILVEVGEHLYIVDKHLRESARAAEKLWGPGGSEIEGDLTA